MSSREMLVKLFHVREAQGLIKPVDFDWQSLLSMASEEGLLPSLGQQLTDSHYSDNLLPEVQELLTFAESANKERNEAILAETVHAVVLLNEIGIQPVGLKGLAYLLTSVYPRLSSRYLFDVDLLIAASQMSRAVQHLLENGYYQSEPATFLPSRHHHPAISRQGSPAFEFHYQLILGRHSRLLPPDVIFARAKPVTYNGATILLPTPTDLVNHLILHSQLAHSYSDRIFPPLRALIDLMQLRSKFGDQIDWHALVKTYKENGQFATLALHLHYGHEVLGIPIPSPIPPTLPPFLRLRYKRRQFLNRHRKLRFADPVYFFMTLLGRRIRLLGLFLRTPSSWRPLLRLFGRPAFYRNLLR